MASSIACTVGIGSVGFSKSEVWYGFSGRNGSGLKDCVFVRRGRGFGRIKAMGGAKYKGTQMKEKQLTEMIEKKIVEARELCEGYAASVGRKVAWDEVEEVSQAKADLRRRMEKEDPLKYFCAENPETDECTIYED